MYESPNPLKLHITLGCNRYPISSLWEKLSTVLTEEIALMKDIFNFKLSPDPPQNKQKTAIDLSVAHSNPISQMIKQEDFKNIPQCSSNNNFYRPFVDFNEHNSAFKPVVKKELIPNNNNSLNFPTYLSASCSFIQMLPTRTLPQEMYILPNQPPVNTQNFADEAHIETLVSTLGKSKQGHICLYCGKCYSRKYGLKIHIRTHTGYKPLKCKYCLRPFGDPSNLNKHVRLHAEGDTPYK